MILNGLNNHKDDGPQLGPEGEILCNHCQGDVYFDGKYYTCKKCDQSWKAEPVLCPKCQKGKEDCRCI